jgi:UDP-3-O-[3-hydroxymyristoyl] glucosamine N-acyltransferase
MSESKKKESHRITKLLDELEIHYKKLGKGLSDAFTHIVPFGDGNENSLIFCNKPNDKTLIDIQNELAGVWIIEEQWGIENRKALEDYPVNVFLVSNPRLTVSKILSRIHPDEDTWGKGVHQTAMVHPEAKIGKGVSIGAHCIVGKCCINDDSRLGTSTIVIDNTIIGKRSIIREFCLIGGCGFGFVRDENTKHFTRFPHIGRAIIEDDVELFPYVNVDRGTLGDTIIKKGAKIDHYSHIGHNCTVGENTIITARTVMCGGSSVGNGSWLGVGSVLKEKVYVGNDVTVGIGAIVIKNVKDGDVVAGVPAKSIRDRRKDKNPWKTVK